MSLSLDKNNLSQETMNINLVNNLSINNKLKKLNSKEESKLKKINEKLSPIKSHYNNINDSNSDNKKEIIESPRNKTNSDSRSIGKFIITSYIGEGAFGKVKLGYHSLTKQNVAIKILEKDKILKKSDKTRVEKEIKLLKMLRHKNIVQLYQVIQRSTNIYLIMEYCPGKNLFDFIQNKKKLSDPIACEIFQQIISGLEYLHNYRIVHRDIKPLNVIMDNLEKNKITIKLIDFGLSNFFKKKDAFLSTQCGSSAYAAPELINGKINHNYI